MGDKDYKLFNVIFRNDDPSVHIDFPYCPDKRGLAGVATLEPSESASATIQLAEIGKLTSHPVKFSYHADGNVHFSQDGKVMTVIRRRTTRIDEINGHMFTAYFSGIDKFQQFTDGTAKLSTTNRGGVTLFLGENPGTIRVVGNWYRRDFFARHHAHLAKSGVIGPVYQNTEGVHCALLAPCNRNRGGAYVLSIRAIPQQGLGSSEAAQLFLGGFDTPEVARDPSRATSFLLFSYPADNYDSLKEKLDSIDYPPV